AFTPKTVEQLRPRIQQLVDDALDRVATRGSMDVVADLAFPLPFAVISEMLGMPDGDRDEVRAWSHAMTKTLDPVLLPAEVEAAMDAFDHFEPYLADVITWKRRQPADDLLSA